MSATSTFELHCDDVIAKLRDEFDDMTILPFDAIYDLEPVSDETQVFACRIDDCDLDRRTVRDPLTGILWSEMVLAAVFQRQVSSGNPSVRTFTDAVRVAAWMRGEMWCSTTARLRSFWA